MHSNEATEKKSKGDPLQIHLGLCYHFPIFLTSNLTIPIKRMFAVLTYLTLACSLCLLLYFPQRHIAYVNRPKCDCR